MKLQAEIDGRREHWSETLEVMKCHFLRRLSGYEITCLSLSRAYGPTPVLDDAAARDLMTAIWPAGNNSGRWMNWKELADALWALAAVEQE